MSSYDQFKRIRNQIRKLDTLSLVSAATTKLHEIEISPIEKWEGFLPWRLLLIIKWGFEYGGENYPLRNVDENILAKLMNLLDEFEGTETNPFLGHQSIVGLQKFLRTLAFQQFWLQYKLGTWVIARQKVLFCDLPSEHPIHITFEQSMNGLRMIDFLELGWLLWSWVVRESKNIEFQPEILFQNIAYPTEDILSFCNAISLSPDEVKKFLHKRKQAIENPYFQLSETSPFIRYPVLRLGSKYLVYSQQLLKETLSNILYDVMKTEGGSELTEKFGFILEKYTERGIASISPDYLSEKELSRAFPDEKVVDFLMPFSDLTLFIEVKAIDMKPIVKVYPEDKSLRRELKDSIIKGTIQGFSLAKSISHDSDSFDIQSRSNIFLMIVTYRNLYLGSGEVIWDEFLKDSVNPTLIAKNISIDLIPPEQIIILSVDEFDQFISVLWQCSVTVSDIFSEMLEANKDLETRKWMFSQHLGKFQNKDPKHPFLDSEIESLIDTVKGKFQTAG
jgi:hypothetical protein